MRNFLVVASLATIFTIGTLFSMVGAWQLPSRAVQPHWKEKLAYCPDCTCSVYERCECVLGRNHW